MKGNKKWGLEILAVILVFSILVKNPAAPESETKSLSVQSRRTLKKNIVFLITRDSLNYEADKTIPVFAASLEKEYGYKVHVLLGRGPSGAYVFPNFEEVAKADLLVVFSRRIALPHSQMNAIKEYLAKGKPLIGIRTANHAFTTREKIAEGFEDWPAFVPGILGCENRGYGPTEPGTDVSVADGAGDHPVIKKLSYKQWHSKGNVYLVSPLLDQAATVLLNGKVNDKIEPVAWTRRVGKSKVFYTSLGHPTDFSTPQFTSLLINAINWVLDKDQK